MQHWCTDHRQNSPPIGGEVREFHALNESKSIIGSLLDVS